MAEQIAADAAPVCCHGHDPLTQARRAGAHELAYRLAVDESPYVRNIRDNLITLITPIVEVDGRDRVVDLYNWKVKHPGQTVPPLLYWGKYVAHDNNRDAMGMTLKLTQNVLNTYVDWKAQVLHDLHESVPFLYDNTIGDGPFNAWIDPLLTNEWQMIGWNNVQEMTRFGMPGVFAHGTFDTWSPGYLMFIAATHNGISRLYETSQRRHGRYAGSDVVRKRRRLVPQNPPLPRVSGRCATTTTMNRRACSYRSARRDQLQQFLELLSEEQAVGSQEPRPRDRRRTCSADDRRPGAQAERSTCCGSRPGSRGRPRRSVTVPSRRAALVGVVDSTARTSADSARAVDTTKTTTRTFPAGSYIVRMDPAALAHCRRAARLPVLVA